MEMSILIDDLINKYNKSKIKLDDNIHIQKPTDFYSMYERIKDSLNVLYGNARAYHYFEDEANTWGEVK
jgi:hypothetical protein